MVKSSSLVYPFYAVKCSDSRTIGKTLVVIGTGFDYASRTEIQLVQSFGVPPGRIINANPRKQVFPIKYDATNGIQMMTFDSEVELMKVARAHPKANFHMGSGCTDPEIFMQAISDASCVFDMGAEVGFNMYLRDIGGGFPGSECAKLKFEEMACVIKQVFSNRLRSDIHS
ncbi:PREDICTED: ornithine decarboxylase-like [Myotis davidii]|uniref:ornithine decarboxylase-like n=1 Tax=Myotis davidii TaxID=225400 RepID=UPI000767BD20|nr:PREDICTED: ornithine decarboxylase-like [Myotis davidii]